MKLLVVTTGLLPVPAVQGGAIETLLETFLKANEGDKAHDITVISIYDPKAKAKERAYSQTTFKFIDLANWRGKLSRYSRHLVNRLPHIYIGNGYIEAVAQLLRKENHYDCVLIENRAEYGLHLKDIVKGKLILHLHNDFLNIDTKQGRKKLDAFDEVYALSEFVRQRVLEISAETPVYLLHNGTNTTRFDKERYPLQALNKRREWGIQANQVVFLYSGRLVPEKGVKELIEAFKLSDKQHNMALVIVGSPTYGRNVTDAYTKSLLSEADERIVFTGYIAYDEMPAVYAAADIGVIPSIWEEPFALTVIEQMATGNPVIISNSGGMLELVTEEEGIIVSRGADFVSQLAKAMAVLAENSFMRRSKGQQAKHKAKLFDNDIYCLNLMTLLSETVKKGE